jgi:hypothetical protein
MHAVEMVAHRHWAPRAFSSCIVRQEADSDVEGRRLIPKRFWLSFVLFLSRICVLIALVFYLT